MIETKIEIDLNEAKIRDKIYSLLDDSTMTKIQQLFADTINPYTPYWHGDLSKNIVVDATGVTYKVPYAKKQYYDSIAFHKDQHPLATKLWDVVAMQSEMDNFQVKVAEILKERAKEIYG